MLVKFKQNCMVQTTQNCKHFDQTNKQTDKTKHHQQQPKNKKQNKNKTQKQKQIKNWFLKAFLIKRWRHFGRLSVAKTIV